MSIRRAPVGPGAGAISLPPATAVDIALAPDVKLDPVAELRELAAELHAAYRADPSNAMLARELRMTLHELLPKDASKADADLTGLFDALQA